MENPDVTTDNPLGESASPKGENTDAQPAATDGDGRPAEPLKGESQIRIRGIKKEKKTVLVRNSTMIPLSLQRIHQKLENETELLKLHLKHYHMSLEQFKRRTSALSLPDSVYAKYELVVKRCEACQENKPPPPRSRTSGLRADNFGDLVFMDHGSVKLKTKGAEKDYTIFIIYDGASHLLWATVTASKEDAEAQECVRESMDLYQCRPKSTVADQAFMSPSWLKF